MHLLKLNNCLFVRYDLNLEWAVPILLREDSSRKRRRVWSMATVRWRMRTTVR